MARPRLLVAPNAFKGCLSAAEAAAAMARGARRALPGAAVDRMPISDGGDGLMEVLLERHGGSRVRLTVTGPLGERRRASYALLAGGREAVIEMAQASGIAGLRRDRLDALGATSRGTGELVADALRRGARTLTVGLGGSATNDGGAGMCQALGARLLDASGRELGLGAGALERLDRVEAGALARKLRGVRVVAVSDVRNPLLGPLGSARVFGPQKGASPAQVARLERALKRYARVLRRDLGRDVSRLPGAGAAGGLGAGLAAFLGAELMPGARLVLDRLEASARIRRAALVLTGEGRLDRQSFYGKAPVELARMASANRRPVRFICGQIDPGARRGLRPFGRECAYALSAGAADAARAMRECASRLEAKSALAVADALRAGALLLALAVVPAFGAEPPAETSSPAAAVPSASTGTFAEIDRLYFHRHLPGNLERSIELLRGRLAGRSPAVPASPGAMGIAGLERAEDVPTLWRLARSLVRLGERPKDKAARIALFKEAEGVSLRAVALAPDDAQAHFSLGLAYGRRGEAQGMMRSLFLVKPIRKEMETAIRLDPTHSGAHHVLGEMLRRLPRIAGGSKTEAVRHLEEAVRLRPDRSATYTDLAQAYLDAGREDDAKRTLERLLALESNDDPAEFEDHRRDGREMLGRLKP